MPELPGSSVPEILIASGRSAEANAVYAEWTDLVERIRSGETHGTEELYQLFSQGLRLYIHNQLGTADLEENVRDILLAVVLAIRRGEVRAERLMGFVRTIVRKHVAAHIDRGVRQRSDPAPEPLSTDRPTEEATVFRERAELIERVLTQLSARDREILMRFYLWEQDVDRICSEMSLTETQFRLLKSRAKARFGELGKKRLIAGQVRSSLLQGNWETSESKVATLDVSRILPVVAHAVAVFGDENKASHWLATALPLLGDRSPAQLIESREGLDLVEQILTRIEHNIPS
jgi:RNA polymerase sigma-70 factor (ECF subfamily)